MDNASLQTADTPPILAARSALMARIRGRDTKPEIAVRKLAFAQGYRYRLNVRGLPGTPDLVFLSQKKVVFVHGCFWHRHPRCSRTTSPKTRSAYWTAKFTANIARDKKNRHELQKTGWKVLVIWECETFKPERLRRRLGRFLAAC
jgi:DNA mismatch endonuclease (patch repair protein)